MTAARLKRIVALEARRPVAVVWVDPYDAAMALKRIIEHDAPAVRDGRAEWIPIYGPPTEKEDADMRRVLADLDRIAERLAQERSTVSWAPASR
jgi:hypothetical protein